MKQQSNEIQIVQAKFAPLIEEVLKTLELIRKAQNTYCQTYMQQEIKVCDYTVCKIAF